MPKSKPFGFIKNLPTLPMLLQVQVQVQVPVYRYRYRYRYLCTGTGTGTGTGIVGDCFQPPQTLKASFAKRPFPLREGITTCKRPAHSFDSLTPRMSLTCLPVNVSLSINSWARRCSLSLCASTVAFAR